MTKQSHAHLVHRVVVVGNPRVPPVQLPRLRGLRRRSSSGGLVRWGRVRRGVPSLLWHRRAVVAGARVLGVVPSSPSGAPLRRRLLLEGPLAPPVAAPVSRAALPHGSRCVGRSNGSRVRRAKEHEEEAATALPGAAISAGV